MSIKISLLRILTVGLICGLLSGLTVLAQDATVYEDPAGRFIVPIPSDWANESTETVGRFVSAEGVAVSTTSLEAADPESGAQAILTALDPDLIGIEPAQTTVANLPSGRWTQNIFMLNDSSLVVLATQWVNGVSYGLMFDIPDQEMVTAYQEPMTNILLGFIGGERLDLTGVETLALTDEMLAELEAFVEEARERYHVPAASIAIVQNGEVIYVGGFGTTELDGGQPVTPETLFMLGSVNKPITTMMIGTLVDDGVLDWDQPVTDILPSFALADPAVTSQMRFRDLLNMSSGVSRYDIILSAAALTPQEIITSLSEIPLVSAPGEAWNYSNQMVATGGFLSALATGSPMDGLYEGYVDLVQERVLDPIDMPNTTFDFDTASANPNHALPYAYDYMNREFVLVSTDHERFVLNIAPAGAVWSNANDMARFLQTELSGGLSPEGQRVISEAALHTTQSPEFAHGNQMGGNYGMGWFLDSYNGVPLIWHGGDTKGFAADLAFLPSADIGVVILTNAQPAKNFIGSVREYVFELAFGLEHSSAAIYASTEEAQLQGAYAMLTAASTLVDVEAVAPYLGIYEYGVAVEMRGDELWFAGAYFETMLHPTAESGIYAGDGIYSFVGARFAEAGDQVEITLPNNPSLTIDKVE
jgi:CubicO group peptidase (beta-lactamase class C family)